MKFSARLAFGNCAIRGKPRRTGIGGWLRGGERTMKMRENYTEKDKLYMAYSLGTISYEKFVEGLKEFNEREEREQLTKESMA